MSIEREQYQAYGPPDDDGRWVRTVLKVLGAVALVVVLFGGAYLGVKVLAGMVNDALSRTGETTVEPGLPVEIEILPGTSAGEIGRVLAESGVIASASDFQSAVRVQRVSDSLKAGIYDLETGMDVDAVIAALVEGPGGEVFRITVIEGLTIEQMLLSIAGQTELTLEDLRAALLDGSVTSELLPEEPDDLQDWEGLLFPDTYEVTDRAEAVDVLTLMAETAELRVASVDWSYLDERGLTPYEGIVIASMIEREARLDEERPVIASVIFNRLDRGMLLQIDATVVYALGGAPSGGLSVDDLEVDSPYNTYRNPGLPPTPIAGPRLASLRAAATPDDTPYIYYVLSDEEGRHAFTDDFDEFLELQQQAREAGLIP
jgi:UPF0755 protein